MDIPEMTQEKLRVLLPAKIAAVVVMLAEHWKCSPKEALVKFYLSDFYRELEDEKTKRWWESPVQLYRDFLSRHPL